MGAVHDFCDFVEMKDALDSGRCRKTVSVNIKLKFGFFTVESAVLLCGVE